VIALVRRHPRILAAAIVTAVVALVVTTGLLTAGSDGFTRVFAAAACEAELESQLRDPESLEIEDVEILQGSNEPHGWAMTGGYRARNGFGGMNSDFFFCSTNADGTEPEVTTGESLEP
jgi:hypothetical protein